MEGHRIIDFRDGRIERGDCEKDERKFELNLATPCPEPYLPAVAARRPTNISGKREA